MVSHLAGQIDEPAELVADHTEMMRRLSPSIGDDGDCLDLDQGVVEEE